jgi:hypothetical protein
MRLREAKQHIQDLEQQLATLADACLQRDALVVEVEPYRSFVEQGRLRMQQVEHGSDR